MSVRGRSEGEWISSQMSDKRQSSLIKSEPVQAAKQTRPHTHTEPSRGEQLVSSGSISAATVEKAKVAPLS